MPLQQQATQTNVAALRQQKRENFLHSLGWTNVTMEPMQADASFRRYYRLHGTPSPMLLMEDPPDRPPVPPFVMVEPFVKIAAHLRKLGLHAPKVHHQDIPNGLLIIEDFGDDTYTRLFAKGADPKPLYDLAVDALVLLHKHPERNALNLAPYDDEHLIDETMRMLEWYYPALTGQQPTEEMKKSFGAVWAELFKKLPKDQQTLVLRDYHVDNLMLIGGATGMAACGLLDFQDAVAGQFSYDLMSLLEDARRDVPADLKEHLYARYLHGMGGAVDPVTFDYTFRVLAAQRHARVLGIFVRLSVRDGKDRYLEFIPHLHKLFMHALNDPALAPLKKWFADHGIDIGKGLK